MPAYIANMAPPIAAYMRLPWGFPVYETWFGAHKTVRGVLAGIAASMLAAILLWSLAWSWYGEVSALRATCGGALLGMGAMLGDLVKSGLKRSLQIASGKPWVPWDQLDFVLGATILGAVLVPWSYKDILVALIITPPLHLLVNILSYGCGMKKVWW